MGKVLNRLNIVPCVVFKYVPIYESKMYVGYYCQFHWPILVSLYIVIQMFEWKARI